MGTSCGWEDLCGSQHSELVGYLGERVAETFFSWLQPQVNEAISGEWKPNTTSDFARFVLRSRKGEYFKATMTIALHDPFLAYEADSASYAATVLFRDIKLYKP